MSLLLLTNSEDATSDFLEEYLKHQGISVIRLDTDKVYGNLNCCYCKGRPYIEGLTENVLFPDIVSAIVFRRPKPILIPDGIGDQFQRQHLVGEWSECIEGFLGHIPQHRWINHPTANYNASHKMEQLSRAILFDLKTPDTIITNKPEEMNSFWNKHLSKGIIAKTLASGWIERDAPAKDTMLHTVEIQSLNAALLEAVTTTPIILQEKIKKKVDVRVVVLDSSIVAIGLHCSENGIQRLDIRRDNMIDVQYEPIKIPREIRDKILKLVKSYHLRFAAIDFAIDYDNSWIFFEINPNGQWAWLDIEGVSNIAEFFAKSLSGL